MIDRTVIDGVLWLRHDPEQRAYHVEEWRCDATDHDHMPTIKVVKLDGNVAKGWIVTEGGGTVFRASGEDRTSDAARDECLREGTVRAREAAKRKVELLDTAQRYMSTTYLRLGMKE
jgi:hypothetical protein